MFLAQSMLSKKGHPSLFLYMRFNTILRSIHSQKNSIRIDFPVKKFKNVMLWRGSHSAMVMSKCFMVYPIFYLLNFSHFLGPRNCIGLRFGMMQARVGLVTLLNNFEFSTCSQTKIPLVIIPKAFILSPEGGMYLNLKPIK